MDPALVLHGHFYQPPRENPWTEEVPREPSAAPFHDWNSRITAECYRPNGWARIVDEAGEVVRLIDNYRLLSFNIGPTLLSWLEQHAPDTYRRIVTADRAGGRAIAQAYGHAILPLCNDNDLRTQIRWGLADFRHRFGREAAGMWLPETAVDDRVLAALAEEGVRFTILAPDQVVPDEPGSRRAGGEGADPAAGAPGGLRPVYRWQHPDRRELGVDLVVYDGDLSHGVAFAGLTGQDLVDRAAARVPGGDGTGPVSPEPLVVAACDGETFGHHQAFADRGVAFALAEAAPARGLEVPRLIDRLDAHPPKWEAGVRTSAWSCAHGVGRWLEDCGCHTGGEEGWDQRWRAPLRAALDVLRDRAAEVFERRGSSVLREPWSARDAYIDVLLGAVPVEDFAAVHLLPVPDPGAHEEALVDALTLLECQRHALLMYTSCGWFFNDLAGIETLQILRYAARCLDLLEELGEPSPRQEVLSTLAGAVSNRPEEGDGGAIWARHVEPSRVGAPEAARHLARRGLASADLTELGEVGALDGFTVEHELTDAAHRDGLRVVAGRAALTHRRTRRRTVWAYGGLQADDGEPRLALRPGRDAEEDARAVVTLTESARRGDPVDALDALLHDHLG